MKVIASIGFGALLLGVVLIMLSRGLILLTLERGRR